MTSIYAWLVLFITSTHITMGKFYTVDENVLNFVYLFFFVSVELFVFRAKKILIKDSDLAPV